MSGWRRAVLIACAAMAGCASCPEGTPDEVAVVVEVRFRGDGMAVDDATVECIVEGVTSAADDAERAVGRYRCSGPAGTYSVRVSRNGTTTGSGIEVPSRDACGTPSAQTLEVLVFGP